MVGQGPPYGRFASRFPLPASRFPLPASRFCRCSCGQEPALFHGAPGERRESVDPPAGLAAGMRPRFSTGQGWPVRKPRPTHANPSRTDARRARTRGGLSFGSFSLATQSEGLGQPAGLTESSCSCYSLQARERSSETGASVQLMVGQGPPYDSREGGPPEGRIERSCALLQAASSEIKRSHSLRQEGWQRSARTLSPIPPSLRSGSRGHRLPPAADDPEPLPRGEGSSAAEQRRALRRQINGRAAPYPRNCGLTTTAPLDLHQCHPDPLERSIPSTSKGR